MRSTEREVRPLPLGPFRQLADALDRGLVALDAVARQGRPKAKGRARGNDLLQPPRVTNIGVLVRVIPLHDDGVRGPSPAPWTAGRRPIGGWRRLTSEPIAQMVGCTAARASGRMKPPLQSTEQRTCG
jgi:hypothetical protein